MKISQNRLALFVAVLAVACSADGPVRDLGTRAVVIGIDGADWKIIEALAADGGMPNLMALREQGTWGAIETLHDIPLSPVIWTSVATGKTAVDHGITWFMVDRPDGGRAPVRSHNRKVKAIWNILAEHDRRAMVVGWWATYPAEDLGDGIMVSDALGFHGFGATARSGDDGRKTHPAELFPEVAGMVPREERIDSTYASRYLHIPSEEYARLMYDPGRSPKHDPFNPIHLFQQYAVTAEGYTSIGEKLLAEPFDLLMLYFEQVDSFSHLFMKYAPPKLPWVGDEPHARFRDVVSAWYRYQDELLGRLLGEIDLDTTAVFVLSDHGFKSGERRIRSERTVDVNKAHLDHETHGIFIAAGPHIRGGAKVGQVSVLDMTPTLLHYLGFPVAEDMVGRVLESVFLPEFMEENPIRTVATFEDGAATTPTTVDEPMDDSQVAANLQALEALGYLGGASADTTGGSVPPEESSPQIHSNMGRIHLASGEFDKAQAEFEKALELDPNYADALLNIGEVHRFQGKLAQAEHFVERAIAVDPNSIGALAQLAELKRDQDELDEAIRLFQEALSIDNSYPFVFLGLGDVLQRAGRYAEAERAFTSVLELDPDSFKAHYNLGVTYGNQGHIAEAVAAYEKSIELAPQHPESGMAHNNLGAIHQAHGEIDEAQARYEQAVTLSPFHLESRYNLAIIYLARDRSNEAIELLEQAAALQPNHEIVSTRLGWAYLRVSRNEDGYRSLLLVRRLYPGNWEANLGLALLHAASGNQDEARRFLDDALRLGGDAARTQAAGYPALNELL